MNTTFLLLGSNLGDSKGYIAAAIHLIEQEIGIVEKQSSLYQTQSWGINDQPDFINQAIEIRTKLSPVQVLKGILAIEQKLGRRREEKWGSRTIDIDILLYDNLIIDLPDLKIPHPFLPVRRFAILPLYEIAPHYTHATTGKEIEQLLLDLKDELSVKKLS